MSVWGSVIDQSREFFTLARTEERLAARKPSQEAKLLELVAAADRRIRYLPGFGAPAPSVVSATLARDALTILLRARAVERSEDELATFDVSNELERVCAEDRSAPEGWERALLLLTADSDLLTLDRIPFETLREAGEAARRTAQWLRRRIDVRTAFHVRWLRRGRFAAITLLLVAVLVDVVHGWLAEPNLALHKPVRMSSARADPDLLVDGRESAHRGPGSAHPDFTATNSEAHPYATIDLGQVHTIHEVRLFNRADDNFDDGLPYIVELSTDGAAFEEIGTRTTHFGSNFLDAPWSVNARNKQARFVRVRCNSYLALSEVEVFGK